MEPAALLVPPPGLEYIAAEFARPEEDLVEETALMAEMTEVPIEE